MKKKIGKTRCSSLKNGRFVCEQGDKMDAEVRLAAAS